MKVTVTAVKHIYSGCILYNGKFQEMPEHADPTLFDNFASIKYKGKNSDGIIDTDYYSPSDFDKEEWDDDDDITDDYEEIEIDISTNEVVVKYYNHRPDYSLNGSIGGYCHWFEKFASEDEAREFLDNLSDYYRGEILK